MLLSHNPVALGSFSWLVNELRRLARRDPRASVAIICRAPATARRLTRALRHATDAKLILNGKLVHCSGVNVTTVARVKALELDDVIVPDASDLNSPNQPASPRALYVAVTRAPPARLGRRRPTDPAAVS